MFALHINILDDIYFTFYTVYNQVNHKKSITLNYKLENRLEYFHNMYDMFQIGLQNFLQILIYSI